jgi:hypothetical protein
MPIKLVNVVERVLAGARPRSTPVFAATVAAATLTGGLVARLSSDPTVLRLLPPDTLVVRPAGLIPLPQ